MKEKGHNSIKKVLAKEAAIGVRKIVTAALIYKGLEKMADNARDKKLDRDVKELGRLHQRVGETVEKHPLMQTLEKLPVIHRIF